MYHLISRRAFLAALASSALLPWTPPLRGSEPDKARGIALGPARDFDFDLLTQRAEHLARQAFVPPIPVAPEVVQQIGYPAHSALRFKPAYALFGDTDNPYPVSFFPLGRLFPFPVKIHAVADGQARALLYSPEYFDIPPDNPAHELPADAGFAGLRLLEPVADNDQPQEWAVFLGASYFRALGALGQYGLSARGIAVNTAVEQDEEFPDFTELYVQPARERGAPITVYALLEGKRLTGAYKFELRRNAGVTMDVEQRLFVRSSTTIKQLGIAPLTSMFWHSEYRRSCGVDWRPEVHDSDGLSLWTGNGERLWRPLNNPDRVVTSSFADNHPRGFGLEQRDRNFEHYLGKAFYNRRPSLWVEPLGDWGKGSVQLVEIPTQDEYNDNIVAFWVSDEPAKAGAKLRYAYRLHWQDDPPQTPTDLALAVATRTGTASGPGVSAPNQAVKFVVEFAGGPLAGLSQETELSAEVSASRGKVKTDLVEQIPTTGRWRIFFHLTAPGDEAVELRACLRGADGDALSETWLYQYLPGSAFCNSARGA